MENFGFSLSPTPRDLLVITAFTGQCPLDTAHWWQSPPGGAAVLEQADTYLLGLPQATSFVVKSFLGLRGVFISSCTITDNFLFSLWVLSYIIEVCAPK